MDMTIQQFPVQGNQCPIPSYCLFPKTINGFPPKMTSNIEPFIPLPLQMWTSPSSSNSTPFPSPSSYAILGNDTNSGNSRLPKTMEEIWKDITLSSLQNYNPGSGNNPSRGMILQDFFSKDPPHSAVDASSPPPPPTMLSLSSGQERFNAPLGLHPQDHRAGGRHVLNHVFPLSLPFEGLVPDQNPGYGKKRFPDLERGSGDRRHKRMIKNRESAARSRARKQAYTNELEFEVAHLLEENARLKKQQQQLSVAAADNHRYAKKKALQRTSTAPF
ncbi:bZIP transcription factor 27-like [Primulina huaijiensis]|uniref:bZIP transcription factor 27-like n=1 Tax=Primulina huaijiensis TaxID=1492673 RepID=UPI003CC6F920